MGGENEVVSTGSDTGSDNISLDSGADSAPKHADKSAQDFQSESGDSPKGTSRTHASDATLADLDKLNRFRFEGKEWSREQMREKLREGLRQEDYTRKTQELAETRKYADNFAVDLRAVIRDKNRFQEFAKIYPREYVERAREILSSMGQGAAFSQQQPNEPYNPRLQEIEQRFAQWEQHQKAQEVEQIQSWLENQYQTLSKKYPLANTEIVTARADVASQQGHKITTQVLEALFKKTDEEIKAQWDAHYKSKVDKQKQVGKEARDVGPGGGVPMTGPKKYKNITEAKQAWLAELSAERGR